MAAVAVLLLPVIGGCGSPGEEGESAAPQRRFLSVGTAPPGGAFFVVGGALSEVMNEFSGDNGWQVTAEATKGTQENIRRLSSGELDFALANSAISYFGVRGEAGWEEPHAVRTVMTLAPNVALFITPRGSEVETMADLVGKRVVIGPAGAGFHFFVRPILEGHGVAYDSLEVLHDTQAGAVGLLADGSAAAAFLGGAVPTASITQAASSQDIHFVPFDAESVAALVEQYPFFDRATIAAGTYRNQDVDFVGMNVGSMHFITGADHDEEMVYQVTRTIYENREAVVEKHPAGRAINPKVVVRDTGTEFHPGAVRYYREIGIWPEDVPEPVAEPETETE
jgi:TRAP transporter TAXI family solute receptor